MNRSRRWLPRLIVGVAALHIGLGLALETPLRDIADAGVVDSIDGHAERESAFWYLVAGVSLLALGELARWVVRETGRVPARLGYWLIGIGVAAIVLMPVSGFWLVAALGALALRASRRPEPHVARGARRPLAQAGADR